MKMLALDQASKVTGWAIFVDNKLDSYGKIDVGNYYEIGDRLYNLRKQVKELIEKNNIEKVILEDIYLDGNHVNNVSTFKILAEVFGVLYELCVEMEIKVDAVLAGTWKSTLGIKGKTRPEQKKNAQIWVQEQYGIKAIQDTVDAICIGAHATKHTTLSWSE